MYKYMEKKNLLVKIFSMFLTFCLCFCMVGCIGFDYDDIDEEEIENMTDEEFSKWLQDSKSVDMHGVKVLYRPESYNYDENSRPPEYADKENNYYALYGWNILDYLFNIYIIPKNAYYIANDASIGKDFPNENVLPYVYDTSRYVVTNATKYVSKDNEEEKYVVTANTNLNWNWSFAYNSTVVPSYMADREATITTNGILQKDFQSSANYNWVNNYYADENFSSPYKTKFLGETNADGMRDYDNYSQFAKTLTYVMYRYALDLEPETVSVTQTSDTNLVSVTIGGKDVSTALDEVKALFDKLGDYVGINANQVTKMKNWILNNVIGSNAVNAQDYLTLTTYTQKTNESGELLYYGEEGEETTQVIEGKEVWVEKTPSTKLQYNHDYEGTVTKILNKVNSLVKIGGYDDENVDITGRYLASQITEYSANMFMIGDDRNFPQMGSDAAKKLTAIPQLEYQSVSFMLSDETKIDEIWVALKYDADFSGTELDKYGEEYIELSLELNYYSYAENKVYSRQSPILKVYDGSYDMNYLMFDDDTSAWTGPDITCPRYHSSGYAFEDLGSLVRQDYLTVGEYNTKIGNKILMTDVGRADYKGRNLKSKKPIVITGHSNVKNYFEIVESETTEEGQSTFRSGRYNKEMFSGTDGCDYLEICYKVYKQPGVNKNYRFYTGIANFVTVK